MNRDRTQAHGSESAESSPLTGREVPSFLFFIRVNLRQNDKADDGCLFFFFFKVTCPEPFGVLSEKFCLGFCL